MKQTRNNKDETEIKRKKTQKLIPTACFFLYFRCVGGYSEKSWDYLKENGVVSGGDFNSSEVLVYSCFQVNSN